GKALPVLESVIDEATVVVSAEAIGIMESLYKTTVEYTKTRKQFGVPIGSFQVLQHRMVDMFIHHEQAKSLLLMAAIRLGENDPVERRKAVSALKAYVGKAGRYCGQQAVQLHGGMGMTDEFIVGHYFKRLTAIDILFGNEDFHLRRFADAA
ncbi:MAG: acyl-CoA dehydrogenase family protein, partial [Gammaproteobacteria bacterium]